MALGYLLTSLNNVLKLGPPNGLSDDANADTAEGFCRSPSVGHSQLIDLWQGSVCLARDEQREDQRIC